MRREIQIDILRIIRAICIRWYLVLLVAVIGASAGLIYTYDEVVQYTAMATVYSSSYGSYSETQEGVKAMQLYSEIVTSMKIAERASSIIGDTNLSANKIQGMIYTNYSSDSSILGVIAESTNPTEAKTVANAVAEAFVIEAQNITGGESVQILDKANLVKISGSNRKKFTVLGFAACALLTMLVIAFREIMSDRVYHVGDAGLNGEITVIAAIPDQRIK